MVRHTYLEHLRCLYVRLELGTAARLQSGWLRVLRGRLPLCERRGGPGEVEEMTFSLKAKQKNGGSEVMGVPQ